MTDAQRSRFRQGNHHDIASAGRSVSEVQPAMDRPAQERYYRCYFISNDHIVGYENLFSHDDVGAVEKLGEILATTEHLSVEL
jgi:hypothetical protein